MFASAVEALSRIWLGLACCAWSNMPRMDGHRHLRRPDFDQTATLMSLVGIAIRGRNSSGHSGQARPGPCLTEPAARRWRHSYYYLGLTARF